MIPLPDFMWNLWHRIHSQSVEEMRKCKKCTKFLRKLKWKDIKRVNHILNGEGEK